MTYRLGQKEILRQKGIKRVSSKRGGKGEEKGEGEEGTRRINGRTNGHEWTDGWILLRWFSWKTKKGPYGIRDILFQSTRKRLENTVNMVRAENVMEENELGVYGMENLEQNRLESSRNERTQRRTCTCSSMSSLSKTSHDHLVDDDDDDDDDADDDVDNDGHRRTSTTGVTLKVESKYNRAIINSPGLVRKDVLGDNSRGSFNNFVRLMTSRVFLLGLEEKLDIEDEKLRWTNRARDKKE
ncbi:hypothetical protein V1478_010808 [Vespula squamosa]|uniref:Uncharacterized protein n=1 Tax=Vespula squamosa TaxID=30214 RepID=A0ABD2AG18_VESSQ